jgi:iron complex outermembrane receptor protein
VTLDTHARFDDWHVLGLWKRLLSPGWETTLQVYFDHSNHSDPIYHLGLNTFDIDFQQHGNWRKGHDFVWGAGYRLDCDNTLGSLRVSLSPTALNTQSFNSFFQDEVALRRDLLSLSLGTKLEHSYYNGFNWQPSARMTWTPDDHNTLWAAVSGAQHTPDRSDTAVRFNYTVLPGPLPTLISVFGNPKQRNERLTATEAGFRKQFSNKVWMASTVFFNQYRDLESEEPGVPRLESDPAPEHLLIPRYLANLQRAETHGLEIFANVKLASRWTLSPGYSFLTMHVHREPGGQDIADGPETQGDSPNHQAQLRSQVNLPGNLQWTTSAYFVGRLVGPPIPSYTRLDSHLAWQVSENISLGLVGQDLLKRVHPEYSGPDLLVDPSQIRRNGYARLTWRF